MTPAPSPGQLERGGEDPQRQLMCEPLGHLARRGEQQIAVDQQRRRRSEVGDPQGDPHWLGPARIVARFARHRGPAARGAARDECTAVVAARTDLTPS